MDIIVTNRNDPYFSDKALKKMTVKKDSILRKLMPFFKENKKDPTKRLLYTRAVPLFIITICSAIFLILFLVDQLIVDFLKDIIFLWISSVFLLAFCLYRFIIAILSRIL